MSKYVLTFLIAIISYQAHAQIEIQFDEINNHIDDSVKFQAKIYGGKYFQNVKGEPTFLNVGAKYPDAPLTLVIWGDVRKKFKIPPEEMCSQGHVKWITGKIVLYKGKPEIVITSPNQIYDVITPPSIHN